MDIDLEYLKECAMAIKLHADKKCNCGLNDHLCANKIKLHANHILKTITPDLPQTREVAAQG